MWSRQSGRSICFRRRRMWRPWLCSRPHEPCSKEPARPLHCVIKDACLCRAPASADGNTMKYHVTLRERTYVIDVAGGAVTVDGEKLELHWAAIPGTPLIHLLLGKESWTVACHQLDGRRWAMGAAGERPRGRGQGGRGEKE